jgi:hypothetical protein
MPKPIQGKWKISSRQKHLLDALFKDIKTSKVKKVVDMGAGRTSVHYLAHRFPKLTVRAVVYPGDERKIVPIRECVSEKNYKLVESDIRSARIGSVDVVLAHLFLGEAEKFSGNRFEKILDALFALKTKYLIIVNVRRDAIDYWSLFKRVAEKGTVLRIAYATSDADGDDCLGFAIRMR